MMLTYQFIGELVLSILLMETFVQTDFITLLLIIILNFVVTLVILVR